MELTCAIQTYHWGKKGDCLVSKFAFANSGIISNENTPYAEFWMGTHPNGPSLIKDTGIELSQYLTVHSDELGTEVSKRFGDQLPFLFKILSVEKPLSIQAHPTKSHAEELFLRFPQIYRDENHKPELAIAATNFEALCSFRPLSEIKHFLNNVPEFKTLIDADAMEKFCRCDDNAPESTILMKECFISLMSCSEEVIKSAIGKLIARFESLRDSEAEEYLVPLVMRIYNFFPNDIGVFCVYWLNYIQLSPGEAIYLAPNEPHAYLHGDCYECMANSDNVVRAGLTPKFRDIATLCEMLTYKNYPPSEILLKPVIVDEFCQLYSPPVNDFAVVKIKLPKSKNYNLEKKQSASILLVIEGCGKLNSQTELEFGKVLFIPSMSECCIESHGIVLLQAYCNL